MNAKFQNIICAAICLFSSVTLFSGCASVSDASYAEKNPPFSGFYTAKDIKGDTDCIPFAHSKALKKVVYSCSFSDLHIVSTDTNQITTLKDMYMRGVAAMSQTKDNMYLYFMAGGEAPLIRELNVTAATYFDRPIKVVGEGAYTGQLHLNPADKCIIYAVNMDPERRYNTHILKVYNYDPHSREPLVIGGPPVLEYRIPVGFNSTTGFMTSMVGALKGFTTCMRDPKGDLHVLMSARRDVLGLSGEGGAVVHISKTGVKQIYDYGGDYLSFLSRKSWPFIYGIKQGEVVEFDLSTSSAKPIGVPRVKLGEWSDFDPSTRTGVFLRPIDNKGRLTAYDPTIGVFASSRYAICEATIDTGLCLPNKVILKTNTNMLSPSLSVGGFGDGFISMSSDGMDVVNSVEAPALYSTHQYWF